MPSAADIERLRADFTDQLARVSTEQEIRAVRDRYLARKGGLVAALMKEVASAPAEVRPVLGRLANELKRDVEERLAERGRLLAEGRPAADAVDVTLPGRGPGIGRRHPLTILRERIEAIFARMGFTILDGPEVEDEYHNFEALNMPAEHPARDMQDTLYLAAGIRPAEATGAGPSGPDARPATLLRTHTSGMQIRYMERQAPPIRIIAPGRVYRRDNPDLTHTPMFQQVEGLVVGERVSLADLKGTLTAFVHELFGAGTPVRFRPSFFPYTEPSAEMDIGCIFCRGAGCPVCKRSGWLEILGSGMVHPAVFEAVGYDPERYTGFAFGMGIERVAILKYGVDDIRLFYENDLRFLEQFPS
jgi:phenylalanyl-tRNA synthetase alpha chain